MEKVQTKTVYDPDVLSDAEYLAASKRASQLLYDKEATSFANGGRTEFKDQIVDPSTGLTFQVYIRRLDNSDLTVYAHLTNPTI
jgi:hypothetical protein